MPNEKAEGLSREELRDKQYREWVNGPNFSQSSSKIWDGGYEAGWQAASLKQAEPPEEGHQCGDRWKPYPEVFCGGCIDGVPLSEVIAKHKQAEPPSQPAFTVEHTIAGPILKLSGIYVREWLGCAYNEVADQLAKQLNKALAESPSQASTQPPKADENEPLERHL